ncbi:MAG: DUF4942 domain-containing protein [Gammaproteobacteria bacterium]
MQHNIALPTTIHDFIAARDLALERYTAARHVLEDAKHGLERLAPLAWPWEAQPRLSVDGFREDLDRRMWRIAFDLTGLMQLMDATARKEFDRSLEKSPPEFTLDNIRATFLEQAQSADLMFARGLVQFFRHRSRTHETNRRDAFSIPRKIVAPGWFCPAWNGGVQIGYYRQEEINDLDRVFKTLDGKQHHPRELETALRDAVKDSGDVYEDDYFRIRGFKNGNAHIEFKRADLLEKANRIIADYHQGAALADAAA